MKIYEPITIKNVTFKSRIVMPPMMPFGVLGGENHTLGKDVLAHYQKRIHGELGLLITHCFSVTQQEDMFGSYCLCDNSQKEDLAELTKLCHDNGTKIFAQIGYPSPGHHRHDQIGRFTVAEIKNIEDAFVRSARLAREAGCDGVEIHGANMFFLNLFSSPISNTRTDEYGGNLDGRLRLAREIIVRIKEFAGADFVLGYRMGWNLDLETDISTAKALEAAGVELLHFSYGIREADRLMPKEYPPVICYPGSSRDKLISPEDFPYNDVVWTGVEVRKNATIPMILVDEIWTLARSEALLQSGAGDFIALGRPFLADENLLEKSRDNPDFEACYKCPECAWFDDWIRCPKQNLLYRERGEILMRRRVKETEREVNEVLRPLRDHLTT
jgi:2,4-dienoyl-CoA reductase-like NADH-dependent reductase (Old Yellow Enzyme family)